jgi:hypothetical protein
MKRIQLLLAISAALMASSSAFGRQAGKAGTSYPAEYEGGSALLKQNHGIKALMGPGEVIFVQHGRRIAIPVESIREISCSTNVHRRFGAAVLGLVPLMDLDKVQRHYVGVTWTDSTRAGTGKEEALFRLSAGEYRDFIAALERLTGKQAIDTGKTPTVVHYEL